MPGKDLKEILDQQFFNELKAQNICEEIKMDSDSTTAESVVLAYIRELDYREVHPFLEYPYSDEGITLFPIIMLKLYNIDEIVIKELLPESAEFT